jgi:very-short-patch-repair endonuclease
MSPRGPETAESHPSSGASRHLLPQGEKESRLPDSQAEQGSSQSGPSPLAGEGGRRPDEGWASTPKERLLKSSGRTIGLAKSLRQTSTEAEKRLSHLLRSRRFAGYKFRRQVPLGPYIADFACLNARLIIELDGSQHFESARDSKRDAWLGADGYRVLRVWNSDLNSNEAGVLDAIWHELQVRS